MTNINLWRVAGWGFLAAGFLVKALVWPALVSLLLFMVSVWASGVSLGMFLAGQKVQAAPPGRPAQRRGGSVEPEGFVNYAGRRSANGTRDGEEGGSACG